jgi:signal-transduction protein with cAMP-binding, CBS, and nucleotidyltransferase domain
MKTFSDFVAEQHVDHKGNPITMQDIRLIAGEGKLTKKTIKQSVNVIKKQRKYRDDLIKNYKR